LRHLILLAAALLLPAVPALTQQAANERGKALLAARRAFDEKLQGERIVGFYLGPKYLGCAEIRVEKAENVGGAVYKLRMAMTMKMGGVMDNRLDLDALLDASLRPISFTRTEIEKKGGKTFRSKITLKTVAGKWQHVLVASKDGGPEETTEKSITPGAQVLGALELCFPMALLSLEEGKTVALTVFTGKKAGLRENSFTRLPIAKMKIPGAGELSLAPVRVVKKDSDSRKEEVGIIYLDPATGELKAFKMENDVLSAMMLYAITADQKGKDLPDDKPPGAGPTPRDIVAKFFAAMSAGDEKALTNLISPREFIYNASKGKSGLAKSEFDKEWAEKGKAMTEAFVRALAAGSRSIPKGMDASIMKAASKELDVTDDTATVAVAGSKVRFYLRKIDGVWRITAMTEQ
jgi:hypothetical protein